MARQNIITYILNHRNYDIALQLHIVIARQASYLSSKFFQSLYSVNCLEKSRNIPRKDHTMLPINQRIMVWKDVVLFIAKSFPNRIKQKLITMGDGSDYIN